MTTQTVHCISLGGTRELRATKTSAGLVVVSIMDIALGRSVSGPLALPLEQLDTLRSALADLAGETGSQQATER